MFKSVDDDSDGMVDENGFRQLIDDMNVIKEESETNLLLHTIDPYNKQKMTFSEIVNLLSNHMVPKSPETPAVTVPLLEKFANLGNDVNNFNDEEED